MMVIRLTDKKAKNVLTNIGYFRIAVTAKKLANLKNNCLHNNCACNHYEDKE